MPIPNLDGNLINQGWVHYNTTDPTNNDPVEVNYWYLGIPISIVVGATALFIAKKLWQRFHVKQYTYYILPEIAIEEWDGEAKNSKRMLGVYERENLKEI